MAEDNNANKSIPDPKVANELAVNLERAGERLADLREDAIISRDALGEMVHNISDAAKGGEDFTNAMRNSASAVKGIQKEAQIISRLNKDDLKSAKSLAIASRAQARLKGKIAELDSQIKVLGEARVNASEKEAAALNKTVKELTNAKDEAEKLASSFSEVADAAAKIDEKSNFFDKMAGFTKQIPGLSQVFGEFENASKAARKAASEGGNAMAAGGKQLLGAVAKMAMAFTIGKIVSGLVRTNEVMVDMQRNMNLSAKEAAALDMRMVKLGASTRGLTGNDMLEAQHALSNAMGTTADLSNESLVAISTMTKRLGLSAEEAAKLTQLTAATGGNIKDFSSDLVGQVKFQNVANKSAIRYQDIMKDVAGASAATQLTTSQFPGGIAKAAYQARKLGLSFSQLDSAGSSLLDFESSIAAEMEAELLLGKDLNLDKARAAALSGNQAVLAAELAKNMGSSSDFTNLNVIQQEALAKAMGMSRQELAETLVKQEAIKKLGGDQSKSLSENLKLQYAKALSEKDAGKREKMLMKLRDTAGFAEMEKQRETMTAKEASDELQQQMTESVISMGDFLNTYITPAFKFMSDHSGKILIALGAIGSIGIFKKFKGLLKIFSKLTKGAKGLKSILGMGGKAAAKTATKTAASVGGKTLAKTGAKIGAKAVGKSLLKKIPIIGALAGIGFAIGRAAKGDYVGAAMELASGAASIIPGIGTGVSVAIDAASAARDLSKAKSRGTAAPQEMAVSDFTIKPLGEDTLTMAGGTKLGGNVEKLLEDLIKIVGSGGNVYLDGAKVGQTLVLNSKLSN